MDTSLNLPRRGLKEGSQGNEVSHNGPFANLALAELAVTELARPALPERPPQGRSLGSVFQALPGIPCSRIWGLKEVMYSSAELPEIS